MHPVHITAIHRRVVRWPLEPRGAARAAWHERVALLVGVATDDGAIGLGEAAPLPGMSIDTIDDAYRASGNFANQLPLAIASADDVTQIAKRVSSSAAARFALETALLVALAQQRGTSVAALWSPRPPRELRMAVVVDNVDDARRAVDVGYECLKIKANSPERVLQIARAVPGATLRVDANRSWPCAETLDWMKQLAGLPIEYIEEPCQDAHKLLHDHLPHRIALDESLVTLSRADLERALTSSSLAALVLKPTLLGGFAACLELAALARRHNVVPIVSHALEGPIGTAACFELARAIAANVPVGLAPHPALDRFAEAVDDRAGAADCKDNGAGGVA